ncbi:lipoate--protein ligase family protein [Solicola gregarius]|uniref:Lipoate--protein ligase family protein n=1 Tax=Solicola gregarius TaxID=2908642 RepID=A0AA46TL04_9ACTN|nr:lipoate--protein ligase family protein [Solicola gregarius]UYM07231.1 lipoate--protein ligase family protein [Solicola gregarius]
MTAEDPTTDVAIAHALLSQASRGERGETLRVYRPSVPTVAFGRSDVRRAGMPEAVAACRAAGFVPVVRSPGGRAVAYTRAAVAIDHICPEQDPGRRMRRRFVEYGELLADAMRGLGVDARVGEVPGEYCPGAYTVNARGVVKLVGTAQRVVRDAWLFSAVVIVDGTAELAPLLHQVYDALELPFSTTSVGSVRDEVGAGIDAVERAVLAAYPGSVDRLAAVDERTLAEARDLLPDHEL